MYEKLRAKFRVDSLEPAGEGEFTVKLSAVTGESMENQDFNKYTPSGSLEMFVDNEKATDFFKDGEEYYLDFTKEKK